MKKIITYGTFDLFHIGHLNLLENLKKMGDMLIVGVSTDEFNRLKGKKSVIKFNDRCKIVESIKSVDLVIPEHSWEQKRDDIIRYGIDVFAIGEDWKGKFDELNSICEVVYTPRTIGVSSTELRNALKMFDKTHIEELKRSLEFVSTFIEKLE